MKNWYYCKQDGKVGPISREELIDLASSGVISSSDQIWRPGMVDWQRLSEVALFAGDATHDPVLSVVPPPLPQRPDLPIQIATESFATAKLSENVEEKSPTPDTQPGLGRRGYALAMLGLGLAAYGIAYATGNSNSSTEVHGDILSPLAIQFMYLIGVYFIVKSRFNNMGYSWAHALVCFLPFANIIGGIACLICPADYRKKPRLDRPGRIVLSIILVMVAIAILSALLR